MTDHVPAQNHSGVPLSGSQTTDATASGGPPVVDDSLREQMARAFARSVGEEWAWEVRLGLPWNAAMQQRHLRCAEEHLLPVVTAYVERAKADHAAAEVERAVGAVRALVAPQWRRVPVDLDLDMGIATAWVEGRNHMIDAVRAALPVKGD